MITFSQYERVLEALAARNRHSQVVASVTDDGRQIGPIYIKHDVEAEVSKAVRTARIEARHHHSCTYYFHADYLCDPAGRSAISEISAMGHEIGYHYDVLDRNDGNLEAAAAEFERNINQFRELGIEIKTVCPHGNPTKSRSGWLSNKDFFRAEAVRNRHPGIRDIVVEFPQLIPNGVYVSDAGYNLRIIGSIHANDQTNDSAMDDGQGISWPRLLDLADQLDGGLVLSVHPHRLASSSLALKLRTALFTVLRFAFRKLRGVPFVRTLLNRFYSLSRLV